MNTQRLPAYASLGWIAILLSACLLMWFVLQPGLPVNGATSERISYILDNKLSWQYSWYSWMLSALGLLMFALFLKAYARPGMLANIGVALIGLGVIPDLTAESLFKNSLSSDWDTSQAHQIARFEEIEMLAMQLTGTIANGAYNLGGLFLNTALLGNKRVPRWLAVAGYPAWLLGLGLTIATAGQWLGAALWFTASAMTLSIVWCTGVTLILFMQPARYRYAGSS
jgi:hypothetical protein